VLRRYFSIILLASILVVLVGPYGRVASAVPPRLVIQPTGPVVTSPLIEVQLDAGDLFPVEMAFQHDDQPFSSWEPYRATRQWLVEGPEQTYNAYLQDLNAGDSFSTWDNEYGTLAWGESFILESFLNMYEATGDDFYLEQFVKHAQAVIAQGDDHAGRLDYRGQVLPGWGTSGPVTVAQLTLPDPEGQPALEINGRSFLKQNQVAIRLTCSDMITGTLWTLKVHRSMTGRMGLVLGDPDPLATAPSWNLESSPDILYPGDVIAYDTYYPWFRIAEIRLYGVEGEFQTDDFELYTAMHAEAGEYRPVTTFTLSSAVYDGIPTLAFKNLMEWGRYWKVRYVGASPITLQAEPGAFIRVYEVGLPSVSEHFTATTMESLKSLVEQQSDLVRLRIIDDRLPSESLSWSFLAPLRYQMALHTGLITYPLLRFVLLVKQKNFIKWSKIADEIFIYAKAAVDGHHDEWRDVSATQGYYIYRADAPVWSNGVNLPFNQQAAIGKSLILLCELTSEEVYCTHATQLAQVFRDGLQYDPITDSYQWHYWFGAGYTGWENVTSRYIPTYPGFKAPEAIFYASLDSEFAQLAYRHRMVFSYYDMLRLANTFLHSLTTDDGRLHCYVANLDGNVALSAQPIDILDPTFSSDNRDFALEDCIYDDKMTATEFLGLTESSPAIYQRVEVINPFPPSWKNSGRAPYGLSRMIDYATWRLTPKPGPHRLCVQVRDAQGVTSGPWCTQVSLKRWQIYFPFVARETITP